MSILLPCRDASPSMTSGNDDFHAHQTIDTQQKIQYDKKELIKGIIKMVKSLKQQAQERIGLTQTAPSTSLNCKQAVLTHHHALEELQQPEENIFNHLCQSFIQFELSGPSQPSASNTHLPSSDLESDASDDDDYPRYPVLAMNQLPCLEGDASDDDDYPRYPVLAMNQLPCLEGDALGSMPCYPSLSNLHTPHASVSQSLETSAPRTQKRPAETSYELKQRMLANIKAHKILPTVDELRHYHTTQDTEKKLEKRSGTTYRSLGAQPSYDPTYRSLSGVVATQVTTGNSLEALDRHNLSAAYEGLSGPYYQHHQALTAQLEGALQQSTQLSYSHQGNSFATNPKLEGHFDPTYPSDIANANIGANLLRQKLETPYGMHTVSWQDSGNAPGKLFGSQFATDASMELRNSVTGEKNTLPFVAKGSVYERRSAPIDLSALTITTQDGYKNLLDFLCGIVTPEAIRLTPGANSARTRYSISGPLLSQAQDAHPQTQISCCVLPKSSHGLEWNGMRYVYFKQHLLELVITPNGVSSFLYDDNHRRQSFGPVDAHGKPATFHIEPRKESPLQQAQQAGTLNQVQQLIQSPAYQTFSKKLDEHHSNLHESVKVELFIQACIPDLQLAKKLSQAYLQYQMELDTSQRMIDAHGMPTRSDICYSLLIPVTLTPNADGGVTIARQSRKDIIVSLIGNIMTTFQPSTHPEYIQAMNCAFDLKENLMDSTSMNHAYEQAHGALQTLSQDTSSHIVAIQSEIERHEKEVASVASKVTEFFQELENRLQAPLSSATSVSLFHAVHKRMQTLSIQDQDYRIPALEKIGLYHDIHALYHACLWSPHTVLSSISDNPKLLADTIKMMQSIKPKYFPHCTLFNELLCKLCHFQLHQRHGFTHADQGTDDRLSPIPDTSTTEQNLREMFAAINISNTSIYDLLVGHFQGACAVSEASLFHHPIGPSAPNASL